jgi:ribosome recycling factor
MAADDILLEAEDSMDKALSYLQSELKGLRTGRANAGLVEHVKVEVYGSPTDLKAIAQISVQEGNQILIRPFDPSTVKDIDKAIRAANIGLTPMSDPKMIRLQVPALSGQVRKQLSEQAKKYGEAAKVTIRNARRDANKAIDTAEKEGGLTEDDSKKAKDGVQDLTKDYEGKVDSAVAARTKEIMES